MTYLLRRTACAVLFILYSYAFSVRLLKSDRRLHRFGSLSSVSTSATGSSSGGSGSSSSRGIAGISSGSSSSGSDNFGIKVIDISAGYAVLWKASNVGIAASDRVVRKGTQSMIALHYPLPSFHLISSYLTSPHLTSPRPFFNILASFPSAYL